MNVVKLAIISDIVRKMVRHTVIEMDILPMKKTIAIVI